MQNVSLPMSQPAPQQMKEDAAPQESFVRSDERKDQGLSFKNRLSYLKMRIGEDIHCGGTLMAALGGVGALAAGTGAALMGGPIVMAAAIGGGAGIAVGVGITEFLLRTLHF